MSDKLEHKHDLEMILSLVKSDAIAISYQSMKQYRENIIKEIKLCLNLLSERMEADTSHEQALHKHIVSQQRELLYGFITWYNSKPKIQKGEHVYTTDVDEFLKP